MVLLPRHWKTGGNTGLEVVRQAQYSLEKEHFHE